MKTQDQKHDDKLFQRINRWWNNFSMRMARWWINIVDWAEDIDFGEILMNIFLILLMAGAFFGFIYLGVSSFSDEEKADSTTDSAAVVEAPRCTEKSCRVDWDLDTITVLAPNEKGYKLHFKGKVPYYLLIENLDSVQ